LKETLRSRREGLGLNAVQMADLAGVPVQVVLRAEFGDSLPQGEDVRARLAGAYGLEVRAYVELALEAAERQADRGSSK
jgi:transcriptional regulator with XRE-family HTH domain